MTSQLQTVIDAARALTPREKLALLQAISRDLQQIQDFAKEAAAFWSSRSIDEIAHDQPAAPIVTDVAALAVDFWPENESADEFNQFIAARRRADHLRQP